jgi:hypothetical protein
MRGLVPSPGGRALPLAPLLAAAETVFLANVLGHRPTRANHLAEALDGSGVVGGVLQCRGAEAASGVWVFLVGPGDRWDDVLLSGVAWDCRVLESGGVGRMGRTGDKPLVPSLAMSKRSPPWGCLSAML